MRPVADDLVDQLGVLRMIALTSLAQRQGGRRETPVARCGEAAAAAELVEPSSGAGRSATTRVERQQKYRRPPPPARSFPSGVWEFWVC
ncbi:MAG: hypothetical protein SGPRY_004528 [Prymnesium sp.]